MLQLVQRGIANLINDFHIFCFIWVSILDFIAKMPTNHLLHFINFIYYFDHVVVCTTYWFYLSEYLSTQYLLQYYGFIFLCYEALLRTSTEVIHLWKKYLFNYLNIMLLISAILGVLVNFFYFMQPPFQVLVTIKLVYAFSFSAINLLNESLTASQSQEQNFSLTASKRIVQSFSTIGASVYIIVIQFVPPQKFLLAFQATNFSGMSLAFFWLIYAIWIMIKFSNCSKNVSVTEDYDYFSEKSLLTKDINLHKDSILSVFTLFYMIALSISMATKFALNLVLAPLGAVVFDLSMKQISFIFCGVSIGNCLIYVLLNIKTKSISNSLKLIIMNFCIVIGLGFIVISVAARAYNIFEQAIGLTLFVLGYMIVNITQCGSHLLLQILVITGATAYEQIMMKEMCRSFKFIGCILGILIGPVLIVWPSLSLGILTFIWCLITVFAVVFYELHKRSGIKITVKR